MKDFLIDGGVPENQIVEDFGGRRTADTCYRAKNYFKVKTAIIITQSDHLVRTQFLCDSPEMQTYPVIADYPDKQSQSFNEQREFLAIWPSIFDKIYYQPTIKSDGKETQIGN
jgi:SanA protein